MTNLDNYQLIDCFYPYMHDASSIEMDEFIVVHQMDEDPFNEFHLVSCDRFFVIVFEDSKHERDSSNDRYVVYRRKMTSK